MFNIGDYARHRSMGYLGTVFGYGHQMDNGTYLSTLRVKILSKNSEKSQVVIFEDVTTAWVKVEEPSSVS